jgi:hypothetical protein
MTPSPYPSRQGRGIVRLKLSPVGSSGDGKSLLSNNFLPLDGGG